MYVHGGCCLRGVVRCLECVNAVFGDIFGSLPSYTEVRNWLLKCGYSLHKEDEEYFKEKEYAVTADHSITVGGDKMMLTLGTSPSHPGHAIGFGDIKVLGMTVSESWKIADVKAEMERIGEILGHQPVYGLSDNGNNLVGGFREYGITHHLDAGHSIGLILQHIYEKDEDFTTFLKNVNSLRLKYHLTKNARYLAPNQRSIARFMNLFGTAEWAARTLDGFDGLPDEIKDDFRFIKEQATFIREMQSVMRAVKEILTVLKNEGLCYRTVIACRMMLTVGLMDGRNHRVTRLSLGIIDYLRSEASKLRSSLSTEIISSDIIESMFGKYKERKSQNKLCKFTALALVLPVYTRINDADVPCGEIKKAVLGTSVRKVLKWEKENMRKVS